MSVALLTASLGVCMRASPPRLPTLHGVHATTCAQQPFLARRADAPVMLIDTSGSEAEVWLQAFQPYFVLAALKVSIALTSKVPTKRATPKGVAVWLLLSGGLYAAIVYRTIHPVGSELLVAALAGAIVPPAYAADADVLAAVPGVVGAAQRAADTAALAPLLGNAATGGDIGLRPTLGGVNLFVFYAAYQARPMGYG